MGLSCSKEKEEENEDVNSPEQPNLNKGISDWSRGMNHYQPDLLGSITRCDPRLVSRYIVSPNHNESEATIGNKLWSMVQEKSKEKKIDKNMVLTMNIVFGYYPDIKEKFIKSFTPLWRKEDKWKEDLFSRAVEYNAVHIVECFLDPRVHYNKNDELIVNAFGILVKKEENVWKKGGDEDSRDPNICTIEGKETDFMDIMNIFLKRYPKYIEELNYYDKHEVSELVGELIENGQVHVLSALASQGSLAVVSDEDIGQYYGKLIEGRLAKEGEVNTQINLGVLNVLLAHGKATETALAQLNKIIAGEKQGFATLRTAVHEGYEEITRRLLQQDGVEYREADRATLEQALCNAAGAGHINIIEHIMAKDGINQEAINSAFQKAVIGARYPAVIGFFLGLKGNKALEADKVTEEFSQLLRIGITDTIASENLYYAVQKFLTYDRSLGEKLIDNNGEIHPKQNSKNSLTTVSHWATKVSKKLGLVLDVSTAPSTAITHIQSSRLASSLSLPVEKVEDTRRKSEGGHSKLEAVAEVATLKKLSNQRLGGDKITACRPEVVRVSYV